MLSDALGSDKSSRLYLKIQKEAKLVTEINAYITGSIDHGLLVIEGKLSVGVQFEELDLALWEVLKTLTSFELDEVELERLKNKIRTIKEFGEQGMLNRAMNLCLYELLGDANGVNEEELIYKQINTEILLETAKEIFIKENCSLLKVNATHS